MIWQGVLDVIDAIESWIAGQSYWVQVVVLLAVLGPLCYLLAGLIDRVVEAVFAWQYPNTGVEFMPYTDACRFEDAARQTLTDALRAACPGETAVNEICWTVPRTRTIPEESETAPGWSPGFPVSTVPSSLNPS